LILSLKNSKFKIALDLKHTAYSLEALQH